MLLLLLFFCANLRWRIVCDELLCCLLLSDKARELLLQHSSISLVSYVSKQN